MYQYIVRSKISPSVLRKVHHPGRRHPSNQPGGGASHQAQPQLHLGREKTGTNEREHMHSH